MIDCVDYVITHKPYHIDESDMYRKLCVGGYTEPGKLSDSTGNNIAGYNDRINELTGLYWIWKNTNSEYVGMSHYRRFFGDNGKRLSSERVEQILCADDFDIIVSSPVNITWASCICENITKAVGWQLSSTGFSVFGDLISERQHDYLNTYCTVMFEKSMHVCSMFVTSRKIMDEYCRWLFSFLPDAADRIDVTGCDTTHRRVAGYFGEALLNVWLKKQDLKLFEMPILLR